MRDWFRESFGEDYKIVYRHRSRADAAREIGAMTHWMGLRPGSAVVDVGCGMGRHAMALGKLGYNVTGLDLSEVLLREAKRADAEGIVEWVRGDMRSLPFPEASFDAAVNWFTSFGYFSDERDNGKVLREIGRVLKPGGRFLIDFLNPGDVKRHLVPESERTDGPSGCLIRERREIEGDFVVKRIEVIPPVREGDAGAVRRYEERVRLIGLPKFEEMLDEANLVLERVYGDYEGGPYGETSSRRLIMLGRCGR